MIANPKIQHNAIDAADVLDLLSKELELKTRQLEELTKIVHLQKQDAEKSFEEKEGLLEELNDRVKNNLEIILELIHVQIKGVQSKDTIKEIKALEERISTIALSQGFYRSNRTIGKQGFRLHDYVASIISEWRDRNKYDQNIEFLSEIEGNCFLSPNKAVPLSLIINEIISSLCRQEQQSDLIDNIEISLSRKEELISLIIKQPDYRGVDHSLKKNKNMRLLTYLCEQIDSSLKMETNSKGIKATFEFSAGHQKQIRQVTLKEQSDDAN